MSKSHDVDEVRSMWGSSGLGTAGAGEAIRFVTGARHVGGPRPLRHAGSESIVIAATGQFSTASCTVSRSTGASVAVVLPVLLRLNTSGERARHMALPTQTS